MVRFIMNNYNSTLLQLEKIYIPIWLDLLFHAKQVLEIRCNDLHSNMVRFIILLLALIRKFFILFTFQYG